MYTPGDAKGASSGAINAEILDHSSKSVDTKTFPKHGISSEWTFPKLRRLSVHFSDRITALVVQ